MPCKQLWECNFGNGLFSCQELLRRLGVPLEQRVAADGAIEEHVERLLIAARVVALQEVHLPTRPTHTHPTCLMPYPCMTPVGGLHTSHLPL